MEKDDMIRKASAVWNGNATDGSGTMTVQSGAFTDLPFSVKLRFENEDGKLGTNPEELIAAAHAGCFSMALSVALERAGHSPRSISTNADLSLNRSENGWSIDKIALTLTADVPGISEEEFGDLAEGAKAGCPVSRLLNSEITLDWTLKG